MAQAVCRRAQRLEFTRVPGADHVSKGGPTVSLSIEGPQRFWNRANDKVILVEYRKKVPLHHWGHRKNNITEASRMSAN